MFKFDILFLLFGFLFYIFFLHSFTKENKTLFFVVCSFLIILHDFIFINISFYTSELVTFILKAWQEYLILFLFILFLKKRNKINKKVFNVLLLLFLLSFYGIMVSVLKGISIKETLLSWRMYLAPIILPCLIYMNDGFKKINIKVFYKTLKIIVVVVVLFALYQNLVFKLIDGDKVVFLSKNFRQEGVIVLKKTLWFYDYFGTEYLIPRWFNMVRDNNIRATSFFVSPIIFAQTLGVISAIFFGNFISSKNKTSLFIFLFITFYGIYLSQVRAGFLFFIIAFLVIFFIRKIKTNNYLIIGIPFFLVLLTFFSLIVFKAGDASTLGRLKQYLILFSDFNLIGYGLGSNRAITSYDSLFISVIFAFGIFSIIYFKLHFMILENVKNFYKTEFNEYSFLGVGLLGAFAAFIYMLFFHYTIGTAPLRLFYFIAFYYLYKNYESNRV